MTDSGEKHKSKDNVGSANLHNTGSEASLMAKAAMNSHTWRHQEQQEPSCWSRLSIAKGMRFFVRANARELAAVTSIRAHH
ncbi:hypothetical protein PIB30_022188 [Stylosanthes scabra]|uniref:Uncharacterized protein n=1 Tax=Stylosanthes scabra TaxID=79078 RepID=A0ABU6X9R3_9FABA|nr:hypothetical protein [Stylosanthes scabra]